MISDIQDLIRGREDHTFVVTFGAAGSGKTTMLAALFSYLRTSKYRMVANTNDVYSARIFLEYSRNLDMYGTLPKETTNLKAVEELGLSIQYSDLFLEGENIDTAKLTFFEVAGEDWEAIDPNYKKAYEEYQQRKKAAVPPPEKETRRRGSGRIGRSVVVEEDDSEKKEEKKEEGIFHADDVNKRAILAEIIEGIFKQEEIPVLLIMAVDVTEARLQDDLLFTFLSRLKSKDEEDFKVDACSLVLAKWDLAEGRSFEEILRKDLANAYEILNAIPDSEPHKFSIGKIDPSDPLKVLELKAENVEPILEWILEVGGFMRKQQTFATRFLEWWNRNW